MIDIENEVFTKVAQAVRAKFPEVFIVGEEMATPPKFPAVFLSEKDNGTAVRYSNQSNKEQYTDLVYEAQVYSNLSSGKKSQAKAIMAVIDSVMQSLGFIRRINQPLTNIADTTIARRVARWIATTEGSTIYRS